MVDEKNIDDIYASAKSAYENEKILADPDVRNYGAYQLAADQIRFAKTGQNVSVLMLFSKKFEKFGQWLSMDFNKEIANAPINLEVTSGIAPNSRHASGQSEVGSKGFAFNSKVREQENKGFIGMIMMTFKEAVRNVRIVIGGKVFKHSKGFGWDDQMAMDIVSPKVGPCL